jgi:HAD superfamily hydrolase (TIGR01548 family)
MIEVSEAAEGLLPKMDGLLFDMDGVLLNITESIRRVNCLAVPYYLREVLGWSAGDDLLTSADIEMFKNAGGFNDDVELTCAIVLHYLVKEHEHPGATAETLDVFKPNLAGYARRIAEDGGGLDVAEALCFEHFNRDDRQQIQMEYRKREIAEVFLELFGGHECEEIFGHKPRRYHGDGFWKLDKPIIDLDRLSRITVARPSTKVGILTGRMRGETKVGLRVAGLESTIPMENIITREEKHLKPDPRGLRALAQKLGIEAGIYIGDTRDDFRTVQNYKQSFPDAPPILAALVLSGPAGDSNARIFRKTQADIIASDVNEVLRWILQE